MKMIEAPHEGEATVGASKRKGYVIMVEPGHAFADSKDPRDEWTAQQLRQSTHIISIDHAMRGGQFAAQWVPADPRAEYPCACPSKNSSGHPPIYAIRDPINKSESASRCLCIFDNIPVANSKYFYRGDEQRPLLCWNDGDKHTAQQVFVNPDKKSKSNNLKYVEPIPPCKIANRQ